MSEIREAVRSRYAGAAKKIELLPVDSSVGCCQVDGPDCGCAGSYSAGPLAGTRPPADACPAAADARGRSDATMTRQGLFRSTKSTAAGPFVPDTRSGAFGVPSAEAPWHQAQSRR